MRLSQAGDWYEEGAAGLWRNPELELALRWRRENEPTRGLGAALRRRVRSRDAFLDRSEARARAGAGGAAGAAGRKLQLAWGSAAVLLVVRWWRDLFCSSARRNLEPPIGRSIRRWRPRTARRIGGVRVTRPQALRGELLRRAQPFYEELVKQRPWNASILNERGARSTGSGTVYRILGDPEQAKKEYKTPSASSTTRRANTRVPTYRQSLGNAYNWLGETLRPLSAYRGEAETAFGNARRVQEELVRVYPSNPVYKTIWRARTTTAAFFTTGSARARAIQR